MVRATIRAAAVAAMLLPCGAPAGWAGWDEGVAAFAAGDHATALREFRALADRGMAEAQFNVGVIYATGHGVPSDFAEAMKWYRKAARQGYDAAQFNLGFMYEYAQGLPEENYAAAATWYRRAARQGYARAQNSLGYMFETGRGVRRSLNDAHMWYGLAAAQGDGKAARNRARLAARMTPAQIAAAQRAARAWVIRFARHDTR